MTEPCFKARGKRKIALAIRQSLWYAIHALCAVSFFSPLVETHRRTAETLY